MSDTTTQRLLDDLEAEKESWRTTIAKQASQIVRLRAENSRLVGVCQYVLGQLEECYEHPDEGESPFPGAGWLILELKQVLGVTRTGNATGDTNERQPATPMADPGRREGS